MKNNDKPRKCTMLTLLMLTALSMNAKPQGAGKLSTWLHRVFMTQQESHMRRGEDQHPPINQQRSILPLPEKGW